MYLSDRLELAISRAEFGASPAGDRAQQGAQAAIAAACRIAASYPTPMKYAIDKLLLRLVT